MIDHYTTSAELLTQAVPGDCEKAVGTVTRGGGGVFSDGTPHQPPPRLRAPHFLS